MANRRSINSYMGVLVETDRQVLSEGYARVIQAPKKTTCFGAAKVIAHTGFCVRVIFTEPRSVLFGSS